MAAQPPINRFIERWQQSSSSERANYQLFLSELCDVLEVPRPQPKRENDQGNAYVFERGVTFHHADGHTSTGRIDLYKRGHFVLEAKQGSSPTLETPLFGTAPAPAHRKGVRRDTLAWDEAMMKARAQAERYVRALPQDEGRPPFIVVVDVGYSLELYSEFSRTGGTYVPYPTPARRRILVRDLVDEEARAVLRKVWTDPLSLDPTKHSARVTRELAKDLATLARSLELSGEEPGRVAGFLLRAIFTMFAEDIGLLPKGAFRNLLENLRGNAAHLPNHLTALWQVMNTGGYSTDLRRMLLEFNGGLFADSYVPPIGEQQLGLLIEAAKADWREVEPAIFGTLLERALDPAERHRLGAHYTPRAYVERLIMPTVIEPLREEWEAANAAAANLLAKGKREAALFELETFHKKLCTTRVLDPACGTGNFLYVTLEHLKRLEGEVLEVIVSLSKDEKERLELEGITVTPEQLLGLEINPRAAKIAELVLWIGYLQWHFRTKGNVLPQEPVIRDFRNIECRDALLAYDGIERVVDAEGRPVTRWDGRTTKLHPVTGKAVPDESTRVEEVRYLNPRRAVWPEADFVVGNPPFIGNKRMRAALGGGYTGALRQTYNDVPETADYVMYWWHKAAEATALENIRRFGLITTNSITQSLNQAVIKRAYTAGVSLLFAIPDHPWVNSTDGAAVRVAMTVGSLGSLMGQLMTVQDEQSDEHGTAPVGFIKQVGNINTNLSVGADVGGMVPLRANKGMSFQGVIPLGDGFRITEQDFGSLGIRLEHLPPVVRPYMIGRDVVQKHSQKWVIDFFGYALEDVRNLYPILYQHLLETVKLRRDENKRESRRKNWWLFGENAPKLRKAIAGLSRYIVVPDTSKFKPFVFVESSVIPDVQLYSVVSDDAWILGVLQSRAHQAWLEAVAPRMGMGNDMRWKPSVVFDSFPFPDTSNSQRAQIREIAESLASHWKHQQELHLNLTMTGTYNVLEKLRTGEPLTDKERTIHQQGLVSVLKELHDELDEAVLYDWPRALDDKEVIEQLLTLNAERAAEEAQGLIRWLRPEYQNPDDIAHQGDIGLARGSQAIQPPIKHPWPRELPLQARDVRRVVQTLDRFVTSDDVAGCFYKAPRSRVSELLETLAGLGQVYKDEKQGLYAAQGGDSSPSASI